MVTRLQAEPGRHLARICEAVEVTDLHSDADGAC